MRATEARDVIVRAIHEVEAAGFTVSGHWSGTVTINRDEELAKRGGRDWSPDSFAEIDFDDPEFKGTGA